MLKSVRKRLASFLAAVLCVSSLLPITNNLTRADETYTDGYSFSTVLSKFQCFVENDLNYGSHSVGALVAGGTANLDCFGEGSISPSYFGNLAKLSNFNSPAWVSGSGVDYLYFNTIDSGLYNMMVSWGRANSFRQNPGYMDVSAAFQTLRSDSNDIANASNNYIDASLIDSYGTLQVDLANGTNVKIEYDAWIKADRVSFFYSDGRDFGPATFATGNYEISIVNVGLESGNSVDLDFYNKIYVNGASFSNNNSLKTCLNASNGGQIYLGGVNLVWNLPDAASVRATQLQGHLLAPNATVTADGGNYEGGIVAKNLNASAEGHFFPYNPSNGSILVYSNTIKIAKVDDESNFVGNATLRISGVTSENNTIYNFNEATCDYSTAVSVDVNPGYIEWVSNGCAFTLGRLIEGTYLVEEVSAPQGYKTIAPFTFTVNHDRTISFENTNNVTFDSDTLTFTVVDNELPRTVVTLSKQDMDYRGRELPGATMKLVGYDASQETIVFKENNVTPGVDAKDFSYGDSLVWTSGSTATSVALLDGTYTLTEEIAPDKYDKVTTSFTFTVSQGKVTSSSTDESYMLDGNTNKIAMFDDLLPTPTPTKEVSISKQDITSGAEIKGATLTLTGKDVNNNDIVFVDNDITTLGDEASIVSVGKSLVLTSGFTATKVGLVDGSYELKETTAPEGYGAVNSVFSFTVKNGVISSNVQSKFYSYNADAIVVFNELIPVTPTPVPTVVVSISKQDLANKGDELPGAQMILNGYEDSGKTTKITFSDADVTLGSGAKLVSSGESLVWVSGTKTTKVNLPDGFYTLSEGYAPEKYLSVSTVFNFEVVDGVVTSSDVCDIFTVSDDAVALFNELNTTTPEPTITPVPTYEVKLSKQDIANKGNEIPGAEMKLTGVDANGVVVEFEANDVNAPASAKIESYGTSLVWTSGDDSIKVNLVDGTYKLVEVNAPVDYLPVTTEFTFTVTNGVVDTNETSVNFFASNGLVALFDELKPTPTPTVVVSISKQDIDNKGIELKGATLELRGVDVNNNAISFDTVDVKLGNGASRVNTDSDVLSWVSGTTATKVGLVDGTYSLKEVVAPVDYVLVTTTFEFTIKDGVVSSKVNDDFFVTDNNYVALFNEVAPTEVSISKKDVDNQSDELKGATLELSGVDESGNVITIDASKVVLGDEAVMGKAEADGAIRWTSGITDTKFTLDNGLYSLREVYSPNGYDKVTTIFSFTVKNGTISTKVSSVSYVLDSTSNTVVVLNNLTKSTIAISKQDIDAKGPELPGAELSLEGVDVNNNPVVFYDKDIIRGAGATIESASDSKVLVWISGTEATKVKLIDGTYTLTENYAPKGYDKVTTIFTFEVVGGVVKSSMTSANFTASDDTVALFDKSIPVPTKTPVSISKKDIADKDGDELEGATLVLTGVDSNNVAIKFDLTDVALGTDASLVDTGDDAVLSWVSGKTATIVNMVDGTYTLEETYAPKGYDKVTTSFVFTVKDGVVDTNETSVNFSAENGKVALFDELLPTPTPTVAVSISKQDVDNKGDELQGATLSLTGVDANGDSVTFNTSDVELGKDAYLVDSGDDKVLTWVSGTTATKVNLVDGTYSLREDYAPVDYDIVTTVFTFTIENGVVSTSEISNYFTASDDMVAIFDKLLPTPTPTVVVTISKQDIDNKGDELKGATLSLTGKDVNGDTISFNDSDVTLGTDATLVNNGDDTTLSWVSGTTATKVNLVDGTYFLKEDYAPNGYDVVTTTFKFTIENGVVSTSEVSDYFTVSDDVVALFDDLLPIPTPTVEVSISKQDLDAKGKELKGATLSLTGKDVNGVAVSFNNFDVTLGTDATLVNNGDNTVLSWVSGTTATKVNLVDGTYFLKEDYAPNGYDVVTTTFKFTVENGVVSTSEVSEYFTVSDNVVALFNELNNFVTPPTTPTPTTSPTPTTAPTVTPATYEVNLSKQDLSGNGDELPGAKMSLTGVDEKGVAVVFTANDVTLPSDATLVSVGKTFVWISGSKAAVVNLPNGTYSLKEEVAPDGYDIVTTTFEFTVENGIVSSSDVCDNFTVSGNTIALFDALLKDPTSTITPTPTQPTLVEGTTVTPVPTETVDVTVIVLKEEDETPIEKAEVIVIDKTTNTVYKTFETDGDGSYILEDLPVGSYTVVQKTTIDGYHIDETEYSIVVAGADLVTIDGIITTTLTIYNPTERPEVTPNPTPTPEKATSTVTTNRSVTRTGESVSVSYVMAIVLFAISGFMLTAIPGKKKDEE